jgi:hypothetical protein
MFPSPNSLKYLNHQPIELVWGPDQVRMAHIDLMDTGIPFLIPVDFDPRNSAVFLGCQYTEALIWRGNRPLEHRGDGFKLF